VKIFERQLPRDIPGSEPSINDRPRRGISRSRGTAIRRTQATSAIRVSAMVLLAALIACGRADIRARVDHRNTRTGVIHCGAVGDLMMHGDVQQSAKDHATPDNDAGYGYLFQEMIDNLQGFDLLFANLEAPVAPNSGQAGRPFVFNVSEKLLSALKKAGFTHISLANNHAYDQNRPGVTETVVHLQEKGLIPVGADIRCGDAWNGRIETINGIRLYLNGYSFLMNNDKPGDGDGCVNWIESDADLQRLLQQIKQIRPMVDAIMISAHWGEEYRPRPTQWQIDIAHQLVESGVDVIIGHHPHVLETVEQRLTADGRKALISYSLGNFVSNQSRLYRYEQDAIEEGDPRDGLLLRWDFVLSKDPRESRSSVENISALPLWTINNYFRSAKDLRDIRVTPIEWELMKLINKLDEKNAKDPVMVSALNLLIGRFYRISDVIRLPVTSMLKYSDKK